MTNPASPSVRVGASYDQIQALLAQALACQIPSSCATPCGGPQGASVPAAPGSQGMMVQGGFGAPDMGAWPVPTAGGYPFGPGSIRNNCAAWPGGPRPLRATYIGGLFPAFAGGAAGAAQFVITTQNNWFLGFKFMAPDSLMGTGLGLTNLKINSMDYLDVVTAIPLEVFNALSDNETQGRIDLAWLQTPNGTAQITVQPVPAGTSGATVASFATLQGFALAAS